jgi:hypothetical protein
VASASDANGIASVEFRVSTDPVTTFTTLQVFTNPVGSSSYSWTQTDVLSWMSLVGATSAQPTTVRAVATDRCGRSAWADVLITVAMPGCDAAQTPQQRTRKPSQTLMSDLSVPGGRGQLVVNDAVVFPNAGRQPVAASFKRGVNNVEATLVDARGAGTWRFEIGAVPGLRPETIRVVAGDVVQAGGEALVFRLRGRPGERIVFSFEAQ